MTTLATKAKGYAALHNELNAAKIEALEAAERHRIALDDLHEKILTLKTDNRNQMDVICDLHKDNFNLTEKSNALKSSLRRHKRFSALGIALFGTAGFVSGLAAYSGTAAPAWLLPVCCLSAAVLMCVSSGWCDM